MSQYVVTHFEAVRSGPGLANVSPLTFRTPQELALYIANYQDGNRMLEKENAVSTANNREGKPYASPRGIFELEVRRMELDIPVTQGNIGVLRMKGLLQELSAHDSDYIKSLVETIQAQRAPSL